MTSGRCAMARASAGGRRTGGVLARGAPHCRAGFGWALAGARGSDGRSWFCVIPAKAGIAVGGRTCGIAVGDRSYGAGGRVRYALGMMVRCVALFGLLWSGIAASGCAPKASHGSWHALALVSPMEREVLDTARPILALDPHANWTASFNRLVAAGPDAVRVLCDQPEMRRPCAPDSLPTLVHTSLIRLLAPQSAPRLSASCLAITLDVLHFEITVDGQRLGEIVLEPGRMPAAWHDLYPAGFDHDRAVAVNVERDRRGIRQWLADSAGAALPSAGARPLKPVPKYLWHLLSRRYADRWSHELASGVLPCRYDGYSSLLQVACADYNLVRAVCVWLGGSGSAEVESGLIERVASASPIVAHNARFALRYSADSRIRALIERYNDVEEAAPPPASPLLTLRTSRLTAAP